MTKRVAIVSGAAHPKGIGYAIVRKLREQNVTVVATDLKGADMDVDVTSKEQIQSCLECVLEEHGKIDILVNNAGVGVGSANFLEQTSEDFDLSFGVNVKGMMLFSQAVIPEMQKANDGVIVNVASLAGLRALPAIPPSYTASKFAVVGLTKAMALEFGSDNIRVNAVCPGSVDTQMRSHAMALIADQENMSLDEAEAAENSMISLGRPSSPDEIASVVAFLCTASAKYLNGAAIPVDGGMSGGF